MIHLQVYGKAAFDSSKVRQCFNQQNSSHDNCYCKTFTESKFAAKYVNTAKSTIQQVHVFKIN